LKIQSIIEIQLKKLMAAAYTTFTYQVKIRIPPPQLNTRFDFFVQALP